MQILPTMPVSLKVTIFALAIFGGASTYQWRVGAYLRIFFTHLKAFFLIGKVCSETPPHAFLFMNRRRITQGDQQKFREYCRQGPQKMRPVGPRAYSPERGRVTRLSR